MLSTLPWNYSDLEIGIESSCPYTDSPLLSHSPAGLILGIVKGWQDRTDTSNLASSSSSVTNCVTLGMLFKEPGSKCSLLSTFLLVDISMRVLILFPLVVLPLFRTDILIWSWLDRPDSVPSLHVFWVVLGWEVRVEMVQASLPYGCGRVLTRSGSEEYQCASPDLKLKILH